MILLFHLDWNHLLLSFLIRFCSPVALDIPFLVGILADHFGVWLQHQQEIMSLLVLQILVVCVEAFIVNVSWIIFSDFIKCLWTGECEMQQVIGTNCCCTNFFPFFF